MQLVVVILGIAVSAILAVFALTHNFFSKSAVDDTEYVICVNPSTVGSAGSCMGVALSLDYLRQDAEEALRRKKFTEAERLFRQCLEANSDDVRAHLGLGKLYLERSRFESAISSFSTVRFHCRNERQRQPKDDPFNIEFTQFDQLPDVAKSAIEFESRQGLEEAVLALAKVNSNTPHARKGHYQSDSHYKLLLASLKLAKKYHVQRKYLELSSMYELASENTRGLPAELIASTGTASSDTQKQWMDVAQQVMNSASPEERLWYSRQLSTIADHLPDKDLRRAATYHVLAFQEKDGHRQSLLRSAYDGFAKKRGEFFGNCAYDLAYDDRMIGGYSTDLLNEAFDAYYHDNDIDEKDFVDTEYALALTAYKTGNTIEATKHFQAAAKRWRKETSHEPRYQQAAFSAAAMALENGPSKNEEAIFRDFARHYPSPTADAFLGLFLVQQGDFEEALSPLKAAANFYFVEPQAGEPPQLQGATNGTGRDRVYSLNEIYERFFERQSIMPESIASRYVDQNGDWDDANAFAPTSHDSKPSCQRLVRNLYAFALEKTKRFAELEKFEKQVAIRQGNATEYRLKDPEQDYFNSVSSRLNESWFLPHESSDVVVQVKIGKEGIYDPEQPVQNFVELLSSRAAFDEAIPWASGRLPKPPQSLVGKKVTILFNGNRTKPLQPIMLMPYSTSQKEW